MCAQLFRNILKTLHLPSGKIQFWIKKYYMEKKPCMNGGEPTPKVTGRWYESTPCMDA